MKQNEVHNWRCGKCEQEKLKLGGEVIPKHFRTCPKRDESATPMLADVNFAFYQGKEYKYEGGKVYRRDGEDWTLIVEITAPQSSCPHFIPERLQAKCKLCNES